MYLYVNLTSSQTTLQPEEQYLKFGVKHDDLYALLMRSRGGAK